ncbi:extracellular matrix protein 1 isoform X2 [Scyliorhinus torazame]|uniref:extracellular matrix protein 1 isoform X2 n=1 Tax=Scyliorhinus torazame TaxID=75743 RepID=UPI003B5CA59F
MWTQLLVANILYLPSVAFATHHGEERGGGREGMIEQQLVPWHAILQRGGGAGSESSHPHGGHSRRDRYRLTVTFPPARPNATNIRDVCLSNAQRVSEVPHGIPSSGFGRLRRKVAAIAAMETGFGTCCQRDGETRAVSCAIQVWKNQLDQYCTAEMQIKTKPHRCCKAGSSGWHDCFAAEAILHGYSRAAPQGTETPGGPTRRARSLLQESLPHLLSPPGEPNERNLHDLCQAFRRRARTVERLESGYDQCCERSDRRVCTHAQWEEAMSEFCQKELAVRSLTYPCCLKEHDSRYECFRDKAPDPRYIHTKGSVSLVEVTEKEMERVCQKPKQWRVKIKCPSLPTCVAPCEGSGTIDCIAVTVTSPPASTPVT